MDQLKDFAIDYAGLLAESRRRRKDVLEHLLPMLINEWCDSYEVMPGDCRESGRR